MKLSVVIAFVNFRSVPIINADFNGLRRLSRSNTGGRNPSVSGVSEARKLQSYLVYLGKNPTRTLEECEGNCNVNDDCDGAMICYRRNQLETVPGCSEEYGEGQNKADYCANRPANYLLYHLDKTSELGLCEGNCDTDDDCAGDLVCFQRSLFTPIPGCDGSGSRHTDYCILNPSGTPPTNVPTTPPTNGPTTSPTNVPTKSPTSNPVIASDSPTPSPTNEPTWSSTNDPTKAPSKSPTSKPVLATGLPTTSPTNEPTLSPTAEPTANPTIAPSKSPTSNPVIATGLPTKIPTNEPTLSPTADPTTDPTNAPTKLPTSNPVIATGLPTTSPTSEPTLPPTADPAKVPTNAPSKSPTSNPVIATSLPTTSPTNEPTLPSADDPTRAPTNAPNKLPTSNPVIATGLPTTSPTNEPTLPPTTGPTADPTNAPTKSPTSNPVIATGLPSISPTNEPTLPPTTDPSRAPTNAPTKSPTSNPVIATGLPTTLPTNDPTLPPTAGPTRAPTNAPSKSPTSNPVIATGLPTTSPTNEPTLPLTADPSRAPTNAPSKSPTSNPVITTSLPTTLPTKEPALPPTADPTKAPTNAPTKSPTSNPIIATGLPTTLPTKEPALPPTADPTKAPTGSPSDANATYVPGELTVLCGNLMLSTGLECKLLTAKEMKVELADGTLSTDDMHSKADGAGVIPHLNDGGWYYMSNSEVGNGNGGVGTLRFAANGDLIGYERMLAGTTDNCGGGVTYWNTWVSCEENEPEGFCHEVDPHTGYTGQTKVVPQGGNYESFAYDNEDPDATRFFVTEDTGYGPLVRYTPHADAYTTGDNHDILKTNNGVYEYLILNDNTMEFSWITDAKDAGNNARDEYPNSEGIDVHNRILNFVSKSRKDLFTLDLAAGTWIKTSTLSGAFDMQPDQLGHILGDSEALYFCEDGGTGSDIHGRDATGKFFTVVKNVGYTDDNEENTGLAFSPDSMIMYVAYQQQSHIYSFWRTDGLPFNAAVAEIKYH